MDKVIKDVGDIQSRLLDHRPIINAETRYFVREFEEKRGHRESRLLDNLNKSVTETNEQLQNSSSEDIKQQLSDVIARLGAANHMAQRIQQREQGGGQGTQLQESMGHLKEEWAEFLKEQQRLKEEVDEEHAKAVGEISAKYNEMKKDLEKLDIWSFIVREGSCVCYGTGDCRLTQPEPKGLFSRSKWKTLMDVVAAWQKQVRHVQGFAFAQS